MQKCLLTLKRPPQCWPGSFNSNEKDQSIIGSFVPKPAVLGPLVLAGYVLQHLYNFYFELSQAQKTV